MKTNNQQNQQTQGVQQENNQTAKKPNSKNPKKKKKHNTYTDNDKLNIITAICARIAQGEYLTDILNDNKNKPYQKSRLMPCRKTVYNWIFNEKTFNDMYISALSNRAFEHLDETLKIADNQLVTDGFEDDVQGKDSATKVSRDALRIATRKYVFEQVTNLKRLSKQSEKPTNNNRIVINIGGDDMDLSL